MDQLVLAGLAFAIDIVFWFFGQRGTFISTFIYTFVIGNFTAFVMAASADLFTHPSKLRRWIAFFCVLIPTGIAGGVLASIAIYALHPPANAGGFWQFLQTYVPVGLFVTIVAGIITFSANNSRARLEAANRQLQEQVQLGAVRLQDQAAELTAAHEIQLHLIPTRFPSLAGLQVSGAWQPARGVGGDYFDVLPLQRDRLAVCIADVSGKGMGAALLMANLQAAFRAFATDDTAPDRLCEKLNRALCSSIAPGKFVTFFYGIIDSTSLRFTYENAGHNSPILLRGETAVPLPSGGTVLGLFPEAPYAERFLQLAPGDCLLLTTDGITEACSPANLDDEFGDERLIRAAQGARANGAHAIRSRILEEVTQFCKGSFHDDASLIVLTMDGRREAAP